MAQFNKFMAQFDKINAEVNGKSYSATINQINDCTYELQVSGRFDSFSFDPENPSRLVCSITLASPIFQWVLLGTTFTKSELKGKEYGCTHIDQVGDKFTDLVRRIQWINQELNDATHGSKWQAVYKLILKDANKFCGGKYSDGSYDYDYIKFIYAAMIHLQWTIRKYSIEVINDAIKAKAVYRVRDFFNK